MTLASIPVERCSSAGMLGGIDQFTRQFLQVTQIKGRDGAENQMNRAEVILLVMRIIMTSILFGHDQRILITICSYSLIVNNGLLVYRSLLHRPPSHFPLHPKPQNPSSSNHQITTLIPHPSSPPGDAGVALSSSILPFLLNCLSANACRHARSCAAPGAFLRSTGPERPFPKPVGPRHGSQSAQPG